MSFDIDPKDQYRRYLLNHPESETLFEVFSEAAAGLSCRYGCDDVTDVKIWEDLFLTIIKEKQQCICKGFYRPANCPTHGLK